MIQGCLASLVSHLICQQSKVEGLFEVFKVMHLVERDDNFIMVHLINNAFSFLICFFSRLVDAHNISRTKLPQLGAIFLFLDLLLLPCQMQQYPSIYAGGHLFNHQFGYGEIPFF